jgi:hypothetical protein
MQSKEIIINFCFSKIQIPRHAILQLFFTPVEERKLMQNSFPPLEVFFFFFIFDKITEKIAQLFFARRYKHFSLG